MNVIFMLFRSMVIKKKNVRDFYFAFIKINLGKKK